MFIYVKLEKIHFAPNMKIGNFVHQIFVLFYFGPNKKNTNIS